MIDDHLIVRNFLATNATITTITGSRIHAGLDTPPEGWQPADGALITFKRRGNVPLDERGAALSISYQIKMYGGGGNVSQQILSAEGLYRAVYDALNYGQSYEILSAQKEAGGEPLLEPDTGWPYVLAFFRAQMRKTS